MMETKKYIFTGFIAKGINDIVAKVVFPDALNHADVILDYTKKDKSDKINYRPVSIPTNVSKMYEKLLYNQLYDYFEDIQV